MKLYESVFAGSWYPFEADRCKKSIEEFTAGFNNPEVTGRAAVAAVVPHAGWVYSGKIACNTISCLARGDKPDVVAVFGMHMNALSKPCMIMSGEWETPFGNLAVHEALAADIDAKSGMGFDNSKNVFKRDNTIELQMPFIKYFFDDARIIVMGTPPSESGIEAGRQLAESAGRLGLKLKIIASTDLTHYGENYGFTPKGRGHAAVEWVKNKNDAAIIEKICNLDPLSIISEAMLHQNACCPGAVAAMAAFLKQTGIREKGILMDYCTSYDIIPSDSFVGYAGILV